MTAEFATQPELEGVRSDVRAVWSSIKDMRDEISGLKSDIREIKTLLTERCKSREAKVDRDIFLLETATIKYQESHKEFHVKCGARQEELLQRVSSLERSRMWMMGASAGIGAATGLGSWLLATWTGLLKVTGG